MQRYRNHLFAPALLAIAQSLPGQCHLIDDFNPGSAGAATTEIALLGELAIFVTVDPSGSKLWSSDGTTAGTSLITVLDAVAPFGSATGLTTVGSRVVMSWGVGTGSELWATDGTAAGTGLVMDIRPGPFSSSPANFGTIDGIAYFSAASSGANLELWRTDGTASGTWLVKEIHTSTSAGSVPRGFTKLGSTGAFLFAATDATSGRELWRSDGTAAGTSLVKDIVPGAGTQFSSDPMFLVSFGDMVYFRTANEVWVSDGTAAGTLAVSSAGLSPGNFVVLGDRLLFLANDATHGAELWISDGTAAGTSHLVDINPGTSNSSPTYLTAVGSRYVFFAATTAFGTELWRSDGTAAGTELFQDIWVGSGSSAPLCNANYLDNASFAVTATGKMFFVAHDGTSGAEPFVYDTGILSETTTYGLPCGGLSLSTSIPHLDSVVDLTTSFIPVTSPYSANLLSLTSYVPPIDLSILDMPGCFLHCGLDVMLPFVGTGTVVTTFAIPDDPTWLDLHIYSQTVSHVPGINPYGWITSNGVLMVVGDL